VVPFLQPFARASLFCGLLSLCAAQAAAEALVQTDTFILKSRSLVGLSALELSDDGVDFTMLSDQGWYLSGRFLREEGRLSGLEIERYLPILGQDGRPVAARRIGDWSDAEGLAIGADGEMYVAFERWTRVMRYEGPEDTGTLIPPHPTFADYAQNRQLESVALHPDGTLYAFSESPLEAGFALYRLTENGWEVTGYLPQTNRYAIVGADFDTEGRLFLLERRHLLGVLWQNRVRLLDVDAPDTVRTLWTSGMGDFDNLEGLAVWQDASGTRVTLVSDNNGMSSEITQFLEFELRR
jgi:hypothetical protein